MQTPEPSPQSVVEAHRPLLRLIVAALLDGTRHARWYADEMDEELDRALSPALVRKGAKRHLLDHGQNASDEEDEQPDYETEYLANLGLCLKAQDARIRVLRSDRGQMPVPGPSRLRQAFYAQQQDLDFGIEGGPEEQIQPTANLVLHWSTDDEYNLDRVYLGLPKSGTTTRASVESFWDEPIWRRHAPETLDGTQVEAEVTELDIYLDGEQAGTGA